MNIQTVNPVPKSVMDEIGFHWHTDRDGTDYIANELVSVTEEEAEAYYTAGNELYNMFTEAGEYVIENNLLHDLNIPPQLHDMIKMSWENDVHWHLYGRFDLAGGIDGLPIKLIEFNADTPTSLFETAIIQWATLKANNMDEESQFNTVFDSITDNFKRLIMFEGDTSEFSQHYDGWKILFSSVRGDNEEEQTVKFLQSCAIEAGFETGFSYLDEVQFDENEGVFDSAGVNYEYWFKLYPWEDIAFEDGLCKTLELIMQKQKAIILNPAYTLIFQSKMFLKVLYDLFPDSPYLLQTDDKPLKNMKQVEKKAFGREGANTKIIDENGEVLAENGGEYENYKEIYQEFATFGKNANEDSYQAGLFFSYESCGLGFRKGGVILDNMSKFVSHIIT